MPQEMGGIGIVLNRYRGNAYLIAGTMRSNFPKDDAEEITFHNSIIVVDNSSSIIETYDKQHLVPFGEYIPLSDIFDISPIIGFSGLEKGEGSNVITPPDGPAFIPQVCYEAIFPSLAKPNEPGKSPQWIVNATNDAWYGDTAGPHQHLKKASFRAIEQGMPMVRSANTGISAIIDSYGRIIEHIEFGKQGQIVSSLPKTTSQQTLYSKTGDIPYFVTVRILLRISLVRLVKSKS
jgi:apolipoprotein N-acyltransferase